MKAVGECASCGYDVWPGEEAYRESKLYHQKCKEDRDRIGFISY